MAILDFSKEKNSELTALPSKKPAVQDELVNLLLQFQQSLDVNELITKFAELIEQETGLDGYHYSHSEQAITCRGGSHNRHKIAYTLTIEDQELGEIKFYRSQAFSESESQRIETFLTFLVYPLRNALRYQQAVDSAYIDPLTNLHNRASMLDEMQRLDSLASRGEMTLSLLIVDIDHFKRINDQFGHVNGDKVIRQVAKQLSKNLRDSDHLFRYGGEEFVIILEGLNTHEAAKVAERLRQDIASHTYTFRNNNDANTKEQHTHTTISVGISQWHNDDTMALLNRADHALYTAKSEGRNKVIAEKHYAT